MKLGRYISMLWRGSIRRQLILGFALASLALMLGFGLVMCVYVHRDVMISRHATGE